MVTAALEALLGAEPADEAVLAALTTIPAAELPAALRLLAREHGPAALPVLRRCLAGRPDWAIAAAAALGGLPTPGAAEALAAAEASAPSKAVRTAVRRALYRLRQAGIVPVLPPAPQRTAPGPPRPTQAWVSAIDGTGSRGVWLVVESPWGERTLLSVALNDELGVLDFADRSMSKKRLADELQALRAESPLPWVEAPPAWVVTLLRDARSRHDQAGSSAPGSLGRWLDALSATAATEPPVYARIPSATLAEDPTLIDHSAEVLTLPELAGWFLDPASVQTEALELLQARESRLVVTDQIKAERVAALVDRVIDAQFPSEARQRWQHRLEETAFVLLETGRPAEARRVLAVARALADPERAARHIPFVRALVERSLEVASEVALGRLSADAASRRPRPPHAATA